MNGVCVIYDSDEKYAKRLMNAIGERKSIPYGIQVFTKEHELISYLDHNKPDMMLISEDCFTYEVSQRKEGRLIVLMDEDEDIGGRAKRYSEDAVGVYKYQSSDALLKEVIQITNCQQPKSLEQVQLIGVFTPIEMMNRIIFSLYMAKALSKNFRVLYISLEEFSGLDEIMPAKNAMTLSDVIYYYRQNCGNVDQRMMGAVCSIGGVDYIAPVQCAEDISYIEPEQFIRLIQEIAAAGGYEKVVFDLSHALRQQWKMLLNCNEVFMPVENDYLSRRKIQSFELYFLSQGMENVLQKIKKIDMPESELTIGKDFWEKAEYDNMFHFMNGVLGIGRAASVL